MQAKLDELLHALSRANNAMTRIDEQQPEDIEIHRKSGRTIERVRQIYLPTMVCRLLRPHGEGSRCLSAD